MNKPDDPIRIGDLKYKFDDLPPEAQKAIMSIQGIDKSLDQMAGQMDLLQLARQGYMERLNAALKTLGEDNADEQALQQHPEEGRIQENEEAPEGRIVLDA